MQPGLISALSSSFSCRMIGDREYITSDVNYLCYDELHLSWIFGFILPFFFLWAIIIPGFVL
jgi:hypothetical protein